MDSGGTIGMNPGDTDKIEILQDDILQSLAFPQMQDRESEVSGPAVDTYEWIFNDDDSRNNFLPWLTDLNEEIYWINGKPGCGKSTLMRFISEHRVARRKLKQWAGKSTLLIASYYFWVSGTQDQKSQAGLLRSLLHQLLQQVPDLTAASMTEIWSQRWHMTSIERIRNPILWSLDTLQSTLQLFLTNALTTRKIVFFVDGLDEFDGDHEHIIRFFTRLVTTSNKKLKLCLSSRSWPVFEKAFQQQPQFKLQDFTADDIAAYITSQLDVKLNRLPSERSSIVQRVVAKAEGVFLWAQLAVQYLQQRNEDNFTTMIDAMPGDLAHLFRWLIFRDSGLELAELGEVHSLIRAREEVTLFTGDQTTATVTLWDLTVQNTIALLDDTETPPSQVPTSDLLHWLEVCLTKLNASSQGMIVCHKKPSGTDRQGHRSLAQGDDDTPREQRLAQSKVTYVHRTVRDWFHESEIERKFHDSLSTDWLPHLTHLKICQASLRHSATRIRKTRNINEIWPSIVLALSHARHAEGELEKLPSSVADELFQTYIRHTTSVTNLRHALWPRRPFSLPSEQNLDIWTRASFGTYESRQKMIFPDNPWWALCTRFGLRDYVLQHLRDNDCAEIRLNNSVGEIPLLAHAVEFAVSRKSTKFPRSDARFVRSLLELGAQPNQDYKSGGRRITPWTSLLENLQQDMRRKWIGGETEHERKEWVGIVNAFIEHGAQLDTKTLGWQKDSSMEAKEILRVLKDEYLVQGLPLG